MIKRITCQAKIGEILKTRLEDKRIDKIGGGKVARVPRPPLILSLIFDLRVLTYSLPFCNVLSWPSMFSCMVLIRTL